MLTTQQTAVVVEQSSYDMARTKNHLSGSHRE